MKLLSLVGLCFWTSNAWSFSVFRVRCKSMSRLNISPQDNSPKALECVSLTIDDNQIHSKLLILTLNASQKDDAIIVNLQLHSPIIVSAVNQQANISKQIESVFVFNSLMRGVESRSRGLLRMSARTWRDRWSKESAEIWSYKVDWKQYKYKKKPNT